MTAEDPVEYNLFGINQVLVRTEIGMTFAAALKAFLRQDPNIIMVGEIRDLETGGIAIKAALTGHMVLSTLHTNSAPETVTRLLDMGLEPFNVASALNLILAQRLLRRICSNCRTAYVPAKEELDAAKVKPETTMRELRFTDEAQRTRHRFAWVPFGGGAHMCLGLHFAYMQAKCFARHFLQNLSVSLEPGVTPDWQMWPIPKPRDGLRVTLARV